MSSRQELGVPQPVTPDRIQKFPEASVFLEAASRFESEMSVSHRGDGPGVHPDNTNIILLLVARDARPDIDRNVIWEAYTPRCITPDTWNQLSSYVFDSDISKRLLSSPLSPLSAYLIRFKSHVQDIQREVAEEGTFVPQPTRTFREGSVEYEIASPANMQAGRNGNRSEPTNGKQDTIRVSTESIDTTGSVPRVHTPPHANDHRSESLFIKRLQQKLAEEAVKRTLVETLDLRVARIVDGAQIVETLDQRVQMITAGAEIEIMNLLAQRPAILKDEAEIRTVLANASSNNKPGPKPGNNPEHVRKLSIVRRLRQQGHKMEDIPKMSDVSSQKLGENLARELFRHGLAEPRSSVHVVREQTLSLVQIAQRERRRNPKTTSRDIATVASKELDAPIDAPITASQVTNAISVGLKAADSGMRRKKGDMQDYFDLIDLYNEDYEKTHPDQKVDLNGLSDFLDVKLSWGERIWRRYKKYKEATKEAVVVFESTPQS